MEKGIKLNGTMESQVQWFIGLDLGSKTSTFCVLNQQGQALFRGTVATDRDALEQQFRPFTPAHVGVEAGAVSRLADDVLSSMGHTVVVANPRRLKAISTNVKKCDEIDAELLARFVRVDPTLLAPVQHRTARAHQGLSLVRARDLCVRNRTAQINLVRGMAKSYEVKLPACETERFAERAGQAIEGRPFDQVARPMLALIDSLTKAIENYDRLIEEYAAKHVPKARQLQEIPYVGPTTSVAFALAVDDPDRFPNGRSVGAYFGLVPRRDQSGELDKRLGITKAGDPLVRRLLTQCAQLILMEHSKDTDLKRFGLRLQGQAGTHKKRAVSAVARKLAVEMLRVLKTGVGHDPNHMENNDKPTAKKKATAKMS